MNETETKTITGPCSEVSEKNGWTSFAIDVGSQYPVRLSTKLDPIIELGRAASRNGGAFDWKYNEVEKQKINEHTGKPFIDRYLSGVEPAGSVATPAAAPQAQGKAAVRDYAPDLKDRMIVRQTALKAAAEIVGPRAGTTIDPGYDAALETMRAAGRFERWVYRDIDAPPSDALSEHDDQIPF